MFNEILQASSFVLDRHFFKCLSMHIVAEVDSIYNHFPKGSQILLLKVKQVSVGGEMTITNCATNDMPESISRSSPNIITF